MDGRDAEPGTKPLRLKRRGFDLGTIHPAEFRASPQPPASPHHIRSTWRQGQAILLPGLCHPGIATHKEAIERSSELYQKILQGQECDSMLATSPYAERLEPGFEPLGSSSNEGDEQEIETVLFDAINEHEILAEDLWIKISWLSFYADDESLRFRFSFGEDLVEDVAADRSRQHQAALLTEAVFPESVCITENTALVEQLCQQLGLRQVHFVERIVYFNAPQGGAYLHHDRERGHAGVVFAQLSGATFWLALSRDRLIKEICDFVSSCQTKDEWPESIDVDARVELLQLASKPQAVATELETFANDALIHLINEEQSFVQQLIRHGYGHFVSPGDVLLLPQENADNCCWHSVFSLSDSAGQALSFAVRGD